PSVKQALVRYECKLRETISISEQPVGGILVLLDVVAIYVDDLIVSNNLIQSQLLNTVGKIGGDEYCYARADLNLPRA
ncbi:MAG: flavin reductase family protein, partial [Thiomicrorhabdus sp.]|nr:flavin reductase family protein [Thiomicrorhabdus sp.]